MEAAASPGEPQADRSPTLCTVPGEAESQLKVGSKQRTEAIGPRRHLITHGAVQGEHRAQSSLAVVIAILLQLVVPAKLGLRPQWVMPSLEGAILVGLLIGDPGRLVTVSKAVRAGTTFLVAAISLANAWSLVLLIEGLLDGTVGQRAGPLLLDGGAIWATNVIVFGIWYWEFDRRGPAARANGMHPYPDLLFPQQSNPGAAQPDWEPQFFDYLYTSFTNASAFSPTDVMPLSRWAKMLFLCQSSVSLITAALVVARVANVFR
jgi:hypothetical protein